MEKILLVVLGSTPAPNALEFACGLSGMSRSKLAGYFFESSQYTTLPNMKTVYGMPYVETILSSDMPDYDEKRRKMEEHIRLFQSTCDQKGIPASVHHMEEPVLKGLIDESRFADLAIVDAAASYKPGNVDGPSPFIKELLAAAQCPVVIAPSINTDVDEIVFCYDGSPSALFAMKQFTYLLPELTDTKGTIVQVKKNDELPAAEKRSATAWLSRHFSYADYVTLEGNPEDELITFLLKKKSCMVVMGAYGRNMVSRFFRHSHADLLIRTLAYPLFITHY
ncbi:universal stress protein [uncultured Chitinophaga sp.]|jgi:Universal stress protein UspA and related nucleotide-binding proteins|uniref:universal stress protein n=1 Tax=uncultured Chitinophaga sp. TaxID=339340 RepID=UPI002611706E|nr:universal stress protein [uncultured Chitinophaga sp.]